MTGEWLSVARRQAGAIATAQLADAGVTEFQRRQLVAKGALNPQRRGVYTFAGSEPGWKQELWIAVLDAGPKAFLCRRTAGALWGLDGVPPGHVDVAVRHGHPRRANLLRLGSVGPDDLVRVDGLPVTTALRTLLDLGAVAEAPIVERAVEAALRRRLIRLEALSTAAEAARSPGGGRLRAVLALRPPGAPPTDSDAETLFVQLVRNLGWPDPTRQVTVILGGRTYRIDFAWRHLRIAVEIDGKESHGPDRLDYDQLRQNQIILDGWFLLRFTWHGITRAPARVGSDLARAWACQTTVLAVR